MLPRVIKRIPVPLIALVIAALLVVMLGHLLPADWGFHATTIGSKFTYPLGGGEVGHGIPPLPPLPILPWQVADPGHPPFELSLQVLRELLPSAFAIAMLGAIESLMAAVVADGMGGGRHDPNAELIALGVGNIICPFFGGIAATVRWLARRRISAPVLARRSRLRCTRSSSSRARSRSRRSSRICRWRRLRRY